MGKLKQNARLLPLAAVTLTVLRLQSQQNFMNQKERWILLSGDVKTAFLQRVRQQPLQLLPPEGGIAARASTFRGLLYDTNQQTDQGRTHTSLDRLFFSSSKASTNGSCCASFWSTWMTFY